MVKKGSNIVPEHKPKERIYSKAFIETALLLSRSMSIRDAHTVLNRVLHRAEGADIKLRTYSDYVQRQGEQISNTVKQSAKEVLKEAGFDCESGQAVNGESLNPAIKKPGASWHNRTAVHEAVEGLKKGLKLERNEEELLSELENPDESCYCSPDEVLVRHQKEHRTKENEKDGAFVKNTVIEVQSPERKRIITSTSMKSAFLVVLAYLLSNHLLDNKTLVFFTDGAKDLRKNITEMSSFRQVKVILDWYHLMERCKVCLSMSVKGRKEERNQILELLRPYLWAGNVSGAIDFLKNLDAKVLRPQNRIDELCHYLDNRREQIPCYALRHELGLRISSNHVEKANDLVVAKRQKNNGMSWSNVGSGALAQISALFLNHDAHNWIYDNRISLFPSLAA